MTNAIAAIDNATQLIVDEMFKNGPEEGCRIWEGQDPANPLYVAVVSLLRARVALQTLDPTFIKEATALLERHSRLEESAAPKP